MKRRLQEDPCIESNACVFIGNDNSYNTLIIQFLPLLPYSSLIVTLKIQIISSQFFLKLIAPYLRAM